MKLFQVLIRNIKENVFQYSLPKVKVYLPASDFAEGKQGRWPIVGQGFYGFYIPEENGFYGLNSFLKARGLCLNGKKTLEDG